ncbi:GAF domain-containing sensor histidine kinase [Labrys monachus]|uniref:histidine kinase n=1 Tax=Labrys monachus TaxID=217067 RepID=A0ABU0FN22_9HYPH|nr:GAF domain-containing sensor histidine kinase [Labrys monachus]MDQ0396011.1 signal transduction histidine kinase [Labrys monachus]
MAPDFQADVEAVARIEAVPDILEVVCRTTGMGFAAVARMTEDRWITCSVRDEIGLGWKPGDEMEVGTALRHHVRQTREAVVIDHAGQDPHDAGAPAPPSHGIQSYISLPIALRDGTLFGTLCAMDRRPARLKRPEIVGMFRLFAELIALQLEGQQGTKASQDAPAAELKTAERREQFIAALGHDLKNPLAAIDAGARMLGRSPDEAKAKMLLDAIQGGVARMTRLIDDVLDLARGRLGGGIVLERQCHAMLGPVLEPIVAELRSSYAGRRIETAFSLAEAVKCDPVRIGQLFFNLVVNALAQGSPDGSVDVRASTAGGRFELSVANEGRPIPAEIMENLFEPFVRASYQPTLRGVGLGLYIASEIAKAHGGTLEAKSSPEETRITFRMPTQQEGREASR